MTGNELEFGVHLDSRPTGNIPLLVSALCYQSLRLGGVILSTSPHMFCQLQLTTTRTLHFSTEGKALIGIASRKHRSLSVSSRIP